MNKFFFLIVILSLLTACQSTKDALTLKKKNNSDEFLVEKKNPLVLPPDYGELPIPTDNKIINKNVNNDIQITLGNEELKINETIKNSNPSNLEKSILKKIK